MHAYELARRRFGRMHTARAQNGAAFGMRNACMQRLCNNNIARSCNKHAWLPCCLGNVRTQQGRGYLLRVRQARRAAPRERRHCPQRQPQKWRAVLQRQCVVALHSLCSHKHQCAVHVGIAAMSMLIYSSACSDSIYFRGTCTTIMRPSADTHHIKHVHLDSHRVPEARAAALRTIQPSLLLL